MWGTKEYFAPEVIRCQYGPQADMWSLGCVVYEMLVGKTAFPYRDSEDELFNRIMTGSFGTHRPGWLALSEEAKSLVTAMLHVDPKKRLSATEALNHPWILHNADTDEGKEKRNVKLEEAQRHHRTTIQLRAKDNKQIVTGRNKK